MAVGGEGEAAELRDPRVGLLGVSGGIGVLSALFIGLVIGHLSVLSLSILVPSILLLINLRGGPLRTPLAIIQAFWLGALSLPLLLNGTGAITLIGSVAAVAAIFYRSPPTEAAPPDWLLTRRVHGARRRQRAEAAVEPQQGGGSG